MTAPPAPADWIDDVRPLDPDPNVVARLSAEVAELSKTVDVLIKQISNLAAAAPSPAPKPTVIEALAAVRSDLPGIGKNGRSEQGYDYRKIEDITAELGPLLGRHGVVIVPELVDWEETELTINGRPWTDQRIRMKYHVYGPAGDSIVVGPVPGIGRDNSDKGSNKALTQAQKYALINLFVIGDSASDADRDIARERDARDPWADRGWLDGGKAEHDAAYEAIKADVTRADLDRDLVRGAWQATKYRLPMTRTELDDWRSIVDGLIAGRARAAEEMAELVDESEADLYVRAAAALESVQSIAGRDPDAAEVDQ